MASNDRPPASLSDKMESIIDFTNWRQHPTNPEYRVFFFHKEEQAAYFEKLLTDRNMIFERHDEQEEDKIRYFFAVQKRHWKEVAELNNIAIGKFRKRFIPDNIMQWVILVIGFGILALAFLGWAVS